ncbi:MAG: hypothetical protein HOW73_38985 [Polyangiaceae bacterium]|nr:hypothetical protein [Polyangiaceae bacterium]
MKSFVPYFPILLVGAVAAHAACGDSSATGDPGTGTFTTSSGEPQACNGDGPDGYCNALGGVPETCSCFDCVETAYCLGTCNDNGTCDAEEDCTCADCFDPGCDGSPPDDDGTDSSDDSTMTSGGAPSNGGAPATGGGGAGSGGAPATGGGGAGTGGAPAAGGAGGAI